MLEFLQLGKHWQLFAILTVIVPSCFSVRLRTLAIALFGLYMAYLTLYSVTPTLLSIFKAIAWFGFYVNFSLVAKDYFLFFAQVLWNAPEKLDRWATRTDREQKEKERAKEREERR